VFKELRPVPWTPPQIGNNMTGHDGSTIAIVALRIWRSCHPIISSKLKDIERTAIAIKVYYFEEKPGNYSGAKYDNEC
jgi:hypothetical protein